MHVVSDLCHKASRQIVDAFPRARIVVGQTFNDAAQTMGDGKRSR